MAVRGFCLNPDHMTHRPRISVVDDTHCTICGGEIGRFRGDDPGLDDFGETVHETMTVKTRAGFYMHLEDAGVDRNGDQLWRQTRVTLGDSLKSDHG